MKNHQQQQALNVQTRIRAGDTTCDCQCHLPDASSGITPTRQMQSPVIKPATKTTKVTKTS